MLSRLNNALCSHQDPADRFIAATAWEYDLILITADEKLKLLKQVAIFS